MTARVALVLALAATGCDQLTGSFKTNGFSGDAFPILVDTSTGALVVGVEEIGRSGMRTAVLDVMSPLSVIDRGSSVAPSVRTTTLTVLGALAPGGELVQPRARFTDRSVVTLHPCDLASDTCEIGTPGASRTFDALLGIDLFASDALRIRRATDEIFIFPDIAGDALHRSRACDAVLPSPFRGGGTLVLGGTEISFTNRRIAIDTCIAPNPDRAIPQRQRGIDALFVLSTAIGPSLINETTYARYRTLDPTAPELAALDPGLVYLPSGPVSGQMTTLPSVALVGNLSSSPRAPCRQVYAHHLLAERNCAVVDDCPCASGDTFCDVPAIIELAPPTRIAVLVVSDADPTLQALRTELRPDRPEVDGILGLDALMALELDIDYAHARILGRCVDRQACGARVTLAADGNDAEMLDESRRLIAGCLGDEPGPIP